MMVVADGVGLIGLAGGGVAEEEAV